MRVVVTRPIRSGEKTATLLRERGHQPILLPVTEPVYKGEAARQALARNPAALAATSAQAVRALRSSGIDLSSHLCRPFFAVGAATAKAAEEIGFQTILTGHADGRALAELIIEKASTEPLLVEPLLYLAGTPREAGFEDALSGTGIGVEIAEIYQMRPVEWEKSEVEARLDPPADAVLFYSRNTAQMFFDLVAALNLERLLSNARFICMSNKVQSAVPAEYCGASVASASPDETSMLAYLDCRVGT